MVLHIHILCVCVGIKMGRFLFNIVFLSIVLSNYNSIADEIKLDIKKLKSEYKRPKSIPAPKSNPLTKEKIDLGKKLYFDPRISKTGTMSCATCHNPSLGWEDGLSTGLGHKGNRLGRHSPTVLNLAWAPLLFWDGRAKSLEEQAKGPILADAEMGMTEDIVINRIKEIKGYQKLFQAAFPNEQAPQNIDNIAKAIASYERTLVSSKSRFDKWIEGDETALNKNEINGFLIYNTKANCAVCHNSWRFTDDAFHDIGLKSKDLGRGDVVKGVYTLKHAFKTPTLRNISERAPYMHDGSISSLGDVIRHYENGFEKRRSLSWAMKEFKLSNTDRHDLVLFLKTLSSNDKVSVPVLPQ